MAARLDHLVDRVATGGHPIERHDRPSPVVLIHAVELGHQSLLDALAGVESALEHDLAVRRHRQARRRPGDLDRLPEQPAGVLEFVDTQVEIQAGGQQHRRVVADRDRDRQRLVARGGPSRERRQVVIGRDPDHRPRTPQRLEPRDREVGAPTVGAVTRDDRTGGDVGAGLVFEEPRDRQPSEIGVGDDDRLAGRIRHLDRRDRPRERFEHPLADLRHVDAEPGRDPRTAREHAAGDRDRAALDVLEQKRRTGIAGGQHRRELVPQRDRLGDPPQLPDPLEFAQEGAK